LPFSHFSQRNAKFNATRNSEHRQKEACRANFSSRLRSLRAPTAAKFFAASKNVQQVFSTAIFSNEVLLVPGWLGAGQGRVGRAQTGGWQGWRIQAERWVWIKAGRAVVRPMP